MPSLFYAGQPDYIEKLNTLATAASMTNGTVAASFLSLAVTGTATAASFVGPLTGNASTATTLATARNINGVSFNGSADITVTAAAGTLTGNTLAAGVTASSLTSVGTLTALTVSGQASFATGSAGAPSVKVGAEQNGMYSDGTGSLSFATSGARVVRMGTVGGTGNYLRLDANNTPMVTAVAGATNADIGLASAGTGSVLFATNGGISNLQWRVNHTASAVNYGQVTGGATGNAVTISTGGSDANRGITLTPAGAGVVTAAGAFAVTGQASFAAGTAAAPSVKVGTGNEGLYSLAAGTLGLTANGRLALQLGTVTNSVNYLYGYANLTGGSPVLRALGSDTNVSLILSSQGTGSVDVFTNGASAGQFRVNHVANSVNIIQAAGAATGNAPSLAVGGTDANISFAYYTKGTGTHQFFANGGLQMLIGAPASSVNYWQFFGAAAAGALNMYADGSDTNIAVVQNTKGTGSHFFRTNAGAQTQLEVVHVASAVNRLQIGGSPTAGSPYLIAAGSDTNINIYYSAKGSGSHVFASGAGLIQFLVNHTASAVNQWVVQGGATGQSPFFFANGTDTNVSAGFSLKGAGNFSFYTGTTTATQLIITHTASTVNAMTLTGSTTGQPTRIGNFGSDANPDILIAPQGTGVLRFGTHSAIAAETVTGYITIKDSAGNTRKLAVVS